MKQKIIVAGSIFCISIILHACSAFKGSTATPPLERVTMQFDYQPPVEGYAKSNSISFILMNPKYAQDEDDTNQEPFVTFAKNMSKDFEEMLTQRGYTYKGPYDTYDELVYAEKKSTDFILEVEIDFSWQGAKDALYSKNKSTYNYSTKQTTTTTYWGFDGNVSLGGKLNLTLTEPQTKTKLWVKSIPMPDQNFLLKSEKMYTAPNGKLNIPYSDVGMFNSVVPPMEAIYDKALQLAWNHLDPEELKIKQKEAEEIRNDAGFKKN